VIVNMHNPKRLTVRLQFDQVHLTVLLQHIISTKYTYTKYIYTKMNLSTVKWTQWRQNPVQRV